MRNSLEWLGNVYRRHLAGIIDFFLMYYMSEEKMHSYFHFPYISRGPLTFCRWSPFCFMK